MSQIDRPLIAIRTNHFGYLQAVYEMGELTGPRGLPSMNITNANGVPAEAKAAKRVLWADNEPVQPSTWRSTKRLVKNYGP